MKVSIIIPCFNMGELLFETLESVQNQTEKDFEILVVNDGSNDSTTISLLADLKIPNGRIINIKNSGLAAARNIGIMQASSPYILALDADDKLHPEYLKKTIAVLDQDQDHRLAFVTTDYRFFEMKDIKGIPKDFDPIALAVENCIPVTSLFRKKYWEEVGGYNEHLKGYQDWCFWISLVAKGYRWEVVREELFYYRDRKGSMLKGSDQRRGELASQIMDIHQEYYQENAEKILKAYASRVGELWSKVRGLQEETKALREKEKKKISLKFKSWYSNWNK